MPSLLSCAQKALGWPTPRSRGEPWPLHQRYVPQASGAGPRAARSGLRVKGAARARRRPQWAAHLASDRTPAPVLVGLGVWRSAGACAVFLGGRVQTWVSRCCVGWQRAASSASITHALRLSRCRAVGRCRTRSRGFALAPRAGIPLGDSGSAEEAASAAAS